MTQFYPEIDVTAHEALRITLQLIRETPGYLDDADCPYNEDTKAFLSALVAQVPDIGRGNTFMQDFKTKWEALEYETAALYTDLKSLGSTMDVKDTKERLSFFKAATQLMEKIVALNERALNLKNHHEFQTAVVGILDNLLEPHQRTEFTRQLAAFQSSAIQIEHVEQAKLDAA